MNYAKELNKVANKLTEIITEARKEYPNAMLFAEGEGQIHIILNSEGDDKLDYSDRARKTIASSKFIANFDSGG
jgi:hypothetical protein